MEWEGRKEWDKMGRVGLGEKGGIGWEGRDGRDGRDVKGGMGRQ